ncbi:MAG TPA: thiamine pyrophosphate-dependent enzyme [Streptosporangiaceae bacterium]|jgi:pyruvate dehydrogenase (quinone)
MTGLLGYGGCWGAINHADVLLMLGTDFPFSEFLPHKDVKIIQVDRTAAHLGRRAPLALGMIGDVKATVSALLPMVEAKPSDKFLHSHLGRTEHFGKTLQHYVTKGPGLKPIRPEYLAAVLSELADDDALFFADTGTPVIWASMASASLNAFGAQLAFPGQQTIALCGDGGFTMLGLGDLLTQVQRKAPVVSIIFNNSMLDFVNIEQQEAGFVPFGTEFTNPDFSKAAEAMGAKGIRIEEPGDVRDGLAAALAHKNGPVVVDVVVDKFALSRPARVPAETVKGFTLSLAKQAVTGKMDDVIASIEHNVRLL